jgi:hypothetical protein
MISTESESEETTELEEESGDFILGDRLCNSLDSGFGRWTGVCNRDRKVGGGLLDSDS